jgi:hypothetical protein
LTAVIGPRGACMIILCQSTYFQSIFQIGTRKKHFLVCLLICEDDFGSIKGYVSSLLSFREQTPNHKAKNHREADLRYGGRRNLNDHLVLIRIATIKKNRK